MKSELLILFCLFYLFCLFCPLWTFQSYKFDFCEKEEVIEGIEFLVSGGGAFVSLLK